MANKAADQVMTIDDLAIDLKCFKPTGYKLAQDGEMPEQRVRPAPAVSPGGDRPMAGQQR